MLQVKLGTVIRWVGRRLVIGRVGALRPALILRIDLGLELVDFANIAIYIN